MPSVVLMSGGIDSTTALYIAREDERFIGYSYIHALSVNYGQRHIKELQYAKELCADLNIPHDTIDLSAVVPTTALTDPDADVPNVGYVDIEGVSPVYVPFRNGLMLSAAASRIQGMIDAPIGQSPDQFYLSNEIFLYFGAHAEDAHNWAYPDCTPEFTGAMASAIMVGSYNRIRLRSPLQWMTKADIIRRGHALGVDFGKTWSCYKGGEVHCGVCPTCRARRAAFKLAGIPDPTVYAE